MDAVTAPSPPPAVEHDVQHSHLVQRPKGMSTSTPSVPPPESTHEHASEFLATSTQRSNPQTDPLTEDTTSMGKSTTSDADSIIISARPTTPRAQTEPPLPTFHSQPRNRSPYSRSHLRSHSGSSTLSAPLMARAHSLPTVMNRPELHSLSPSPLPFGRSSSPLRSPKRTRSPRGLEHRPVPGSPHDRYGSGIRPASAGSFEGAPSVCDISEDAELELTPRSGTTLSSLYSSTGSLSRRRRPASPLHHMSAPLGISPTSNPTVSTPTSGTSSPLLAPSKFNEHYPSSLTSSSVSSTPTSMRSRSPSISSLETIEDSPDAEEKAIEEDRIAKLKAAADREDGGDGRRSSLDVPEGRGRSIGFGKRDSRKRWSVCGAERRQDLDLETIWED